MSKALAEFLLLNNLRLFFNIIPQFTNLLNWYHSLKKIFSYIIMQSIFNKNNKKANKRKN